MSECPRSGNGPTRCACGPCAACGFQKHTAVHGPVQGGEPGSAPWGHAFVAGGDANFEGWSLRRLAWAYGHSKKHSPEEARLRRALLARARILIAEEDQIDGH